MTTLGYYPGCSLHGTGRELDQSIRALAEVAGDDPTEPIPPEEQERIFAKFQQGSHTTGRRVGTGLGLSFCKLVVEAHGGQIWVESEIGEGSTFVMRLPTSRID